VNGKANEKTERLLTLAGLRVVERSGVLALAEHPSTGGGEKKGDTRLKSGDSWQDNKRLYGNGNGLERRREIEHSTHLRASCRPKELRHPRLGYGKRPESIDNLSSN
jgi:hypothetical protein